MKEIPTTYDQSHESEIYKLWEESGFFNPDNLEGKPYTIIMPPSNANGHVHVGHALGFTLQDIMIRFERMRGRKTLWLPGTDHAGFETQVVFEKKLDKEGRSRFQMTREQFYQETWDFVQQYKKLTEDGIRRLGASVDWSRNMFTLDPRIIKIVYETFEQMYHDGLVYRGNRICNWCVKHQTGLSELETEHEQRTDPLYYIKYGPLTLATVRPETKFGDTAIAVNPKDARYKKYIGKEIEAESLLGMIKMKVIADELVDKDFGTGVVKITPAHDAMDYEIWQKHKDEIPGPKQVIDKRGKMDLPGTKYHGLKIMEARKVVVEDMQKMGLIEKIDEAYKHNVSLCYKCKNVLEPLIIPQWYIAMTKEISGKKSLRDMAVEAVKTKKVKINPARFEKVFMHWMKNIRDWPISRQIWWGIPIPVKYCVACETPKISGKTGAKIWIIRHGETEWNKEERAQGQIDIPLNKEGLVQAEDAAKRLSAQKIDIIISSDLQRARQTAEAIAKATGAKLIIDEKLRERHFGIVQGMVHKDWVDKHDVWSHYDARPEGGESVREFEQRIHKAFEVHKQTFDGKNIAIVTHGGVIRMLLSKIRQLDYFAMANHRTGNAEILELENHEACKKCGGDFYESDPDTFDTWFSSGQWPYATLKALSQKDFEIFYPTQTMETGWDILFFWVARMIMFGLYKTGKPPFENVYLHGLVRDKERQKMSKSKGNVIDPLGVIDTFGNDALRMALVVGNLPGNDLPLAEDKVRGYRNFANKIWNAARFVMQNTEGLDEKTKLTPAHKAIIKDLDKISKDITKLLEKQDLAHAAENLYHYFWHTFADKIIEESKAQLADPKTKASAQLMLKTVLETCLKLLHPFMPFVTESIWQMEHKDLLLVAKWPGKK